MGWFDKKPGGPNDVPGTPGSRAPSPHTGSEPASPAHSPATAAPAQPTQPEASWQGEPESAVRSSLASVFSTMTGRTAEAAPAQVAATRTGESASVFAESADIEGSLEGDGDVVLRGQVRGSINITGTLVVGETGRVHADVAAREVINAGTVQGNIRALEKVRVQATGMVHGDIDSPSIVIDDGGGVEGFVQMAPPGGEDFDDEDDRPPTVAVAHQVAAPQAPPPAAGRLSRPATPGGLRPWQLPPGAVATPPAAGLLSQPAGAPMAAAAEGSLASEPRMAEPLAGPLESPVADPFGDVETSTGGNGHGTSIEGDEPVLGDVLGHAPPPPPPPGSAL